MLDWSWGQKYDVVPEPAPGSAGLFSDPANDADTRATADSSRDRLFPHGFHVNHDLRAAVPNDPPTRWRDDDMRISCKSGVARLRSHGRHSSHAGRKRSCAEITNDDDESDESSRLTASSSGGDSSGSPMKEGYETTYGPGMTVTHANSRTGAWSANAELAEELAERLRSSSVSERPRMGESRKSIRLDPGADAGAGAGVEGNGCGDGDVMFDVGPAEVDAATAAPLSPPAHDEAALALGVGWSNLPVNPTMSAAARGWARYIEMAFCLRRAKVVWQNEGMGVLLVSAATPEGSPGYFLFDEGLRAGRMVAKSWERCLDNLRCSPHVFDGVGVMVGGERGFEGSEGGVESGAGGDWGLPLEREEEEEEDGRMEVD